MHGVSLVFITAHPSSACCDHCATPSFVVIDTVSMRVVNECTYRPHRQAWDQHTVKGPELGCTFERLCLKVHDAPWWWSHRFQGQGFREVRTLRTCDCRPSSAIGGVGEGSVHTSVFIFRMTHFPRTLESPNPRVNKITGVHTHTWQRCSGPS